MDLKFPCTVFSIIANHNELQKRKKEIISALELLRPDFHRPKDDWRSSMEKDERISVKILYAELVRLEEEIRDLVNTRVTIALWDEPPVDKSPTFDVDDREDK